MIRSLRERLIFVASICVAAIPFAFGLLRLLSTGTDHRYLWLALASFLGATTVMVIGKPGGRPTTTILALAGAAAIIATLLAMSAALLLGTRAGAGAWIVALGFGVCSAAGAALAALSRPRAV